MRTQLVTWVLSAAVVVLFCAVPVVAVPIGGALVMHYDAANVVVTGINDVSSWTNQGTAGATLNAPTTTAPDYPTLITSGPNGQPVVRFNGVNRMQTGPLGTDLAQPTTVLSVSFVNSFVSDLSPVIFDGRIGSKRHGFYFLTTGEPRMFTSLERGPVSIPSFSGYNLWTTYFNATTSALNLNGGNVALTAGGTGTHVLDGLTIGARFAPNGTDDYFLNGDIAEILVYNRQLNTAEINILSNHYSAKYALPIATNLYDGDNPGLGNYDFNVFGIGSAAATTGFTAGTVTTGSSQNGLNIVSTGNLDQGDYVLAGDTNGAGGFTALDGNDSRWTRIWYLQETGESDVNLEFDFTEYGEGSFVLPSGAHFALLYDETNPLALDVLSDDYTWDGNTVTFALLGSDLGNGYYTLAIIVPPAPEPTTAWMLSCGALALLQFNRRRTGVREA